MYKYTAKTKYKSMFISRQRKVQSDSYVPPETPTIICNHSTPCSHVFDLQSNSKLSSGFPEALTNFLVEGEVTKHSFAKG
jgi:hypothetical protein